MIDLTEWVAARRPPMPEPLKAHVVTMLERHAPPTGDVAERLAAAALGGLAAVIDGPGGRTSAAPLLAADALLTYACEAAAESGPEALDRLTRALAPSRFDGLLTGSKAFE